MRTHSWHNTIAVFGGSFDPPHLSHLEAVKGLFLHPGFKKVWIIPSGDPPLKIPRTSAVHRLKMTKLTFAELLNKESCELLDLEMNPKDSGPQYSYFTIEKLKIKSPNLAFIIGSDQLNQLPNWFRFPDILRLCHWIILKRKEDASTMKDHEILYKNLERLKTENLIKEISSDTFEIKKSDFLMKVIETSAPALSSRFIREHIALKGITPKLNNLLHPSVIEYLKSEHLYGI